MDPPQLLPTTSSSSFAKEEDGHNNGRRNHHRHHQHPSLRPPRRISHVIVGLVFLGGSMMILQQRLIGCENQSSNYYETQLQIKEQEMMELKKKMEQTTTTAAISSTTVETRDLHQRKKEDQQEVPPRNRKKRWAIMMLGGARTYAFTRESFLENVVSQITTKTTTDGHDDDEDGGSSSQEVDIFAYSFFLPYGDNNGNNNDNDICPIDALSLHLLEQDSTVLKIDHQYKTIKFKVSDYVTTRDRFLRQQTELWELVEDYSAKNNITYDYIFWTRPDLFYPIPFQMKSLANELDQRQQQRINSSQNDHTTTTNTTVGTFFSPECCAYNDGYCDRLAAATYPDFSIMVRNTENFYKENNKVIRKLAYEFAMRSIVEHANLTSFDLLPKSSYGFVTLRYNILLKHCAAAAAQNDNNSTTTSLKSTNNYYKVNERGQFWCDTGCYVKVKPKLDPSAVKEIDFISNHRASCRLLQQSNCTGMK